MFRLGPLPSWVAGLLLRLRKAMSRRLQEPDGRLEESTEESTVGPYHVGCRTNAAYSNLAMPEKCLTKIGGEAGRHCGDVVGICRIGFVAVRAWCARSAAAAGTITQERAISMIFANPASIVAPGAVPHQRAPSQRKPMSARSAYSVASALTSRKEIGTRCAAIMFRGSRQFHPILSEPKPRRSINVVGCRPRVSAALLSLPAIPFCIFSCHVL
jgi:hypothetical protein